MKKIFGLLVFSLLAACKQTSVSQVSTSIVSGYPSSQVNKIRVCYIGTATMLMEIDGLRIITDPALEAHGKYYDFGYGTGSTKTKDPVLPPEGIGRVDLALVSHAHADNFDEEGRNVVSSAKKVLTTPKVKAVLGENAVVIDDWQSVEVETPNQTKIEVVATPARHGPIGSEPIVGKTIGFILKWKGQRHGGVYISGDTVLYSGVKEIGMRHKISTAFLHLGNVGFPITAWAQYTLDGRDAAKLTHELGARKVLPLHFDGWTHFREGRAEAEKAFKDAGMEKLTHWLTPGVWEEIEI